MNRNIMRTAAWIACVVGISMHMALAWAEDKAVAPPMAPPATRPAPKPLSDNIRKGLAYLARTQLSNGAWAQGDESAAMGNALDNIKASPNVADTCMAVRALVRSGSTPGSGEYQNQIAKALDFICGQVEASDANDLYVTALRGTRTQMKLGSYIDTFMAAQTLAEVKNLMPDPASTKRVNQALAKVLKKIELNQQPDGRWAGGGWAPVLAQGQATAAINVAEQNGAAVNEKTRAAAEQVARADFSKMNVAGGGTLTLTGSTGATLSLSGATTVTGSGGVFGGSGGDAGVELYSRAAQVAGMQNSANTNASLRPQYFLTANSAATQPAARAEAQAQLKRFDENDKDLAQAQNDLLGRLQDKQFVAGFGSNGGEEFLSYLNIGESLILKGGAAWEKWDKSITDNLNRIQNGDGSWSGEHCITGRTFCSAAAVMVLTVDRAPIPVAPTTQPVGNAQG